LLLALVRLKVVNEANPSCNGSTWPNLRALAFSTRVVSEACSADGIVVVQDYFFKGEKLLADLYKWRGVGSRFCGVEVQQGTVKERE